MSTNPWYIPGSLRNLPPEGGRVPGFEFVFRSPFPHNLLCVAHRMTLMAGDREIGQDRLRISRKGVTVRAADLVKTACTDLLGDRIQVLAEYPGGLPPGTHRIRLEVLLGGYYGGDPTGKPLVFCEFEESVR